MSGPRVISRRLRELREAKGWSARELARRARVAPSIITTAERGEHIPRVENLLKLASALDVSVGELVEGSIHPSA
jgi:transcriptional regulator with XRE-family HTH domain